jgi:gamma-glutamyl hydrolase
MRLNEITIGIVTVPLSKTRPDKTYSSYLPNSYVKWLEMSGAKVAPIQFNISNDMLLSTLSQLNGVVFPGGSVDRISGDYYKKYIETYKHIYNYAKKQTDNGIYYPLWSTCLGFEFMILMEKHTNEEIHDYYTQNIIIHKTNATRYNVPLNLSTLHNKYNLLLNNFFSEFSYNDIIKYSSECLLYMNHEYGYPITGDFLDEYNFFDILLTNKDKDGVEYISAIKHKKYPFYGVQFHPEKPVFEWLDETINHKETAIEFSYKLSTMFHKECLKNKNTLADESLLIYYYTLYSRENILDIIEPKHHKNEKYKSLFERSYYFK